MWQRRNTSLGNSVFGAGAVVALLATGENALAEDQAPAPPSASALEEVVVSAQKVSQRELDVPVAVSTIESQSLVSQNLVQISDYYQQISGLQYAGSAVNELSLRGVTTGGGLTSPTLAVLVDDVPFGGTSFLANQPFRTSTPRPRSHRGPARPSGHTVRRVQSRRSD